MNLQNNNIISVIVITYNQENLIGRALDSILIQKEWGLKEIIVCDDCSIDKNWDVIIEYSIKYPKLIKPFKNEHNLGIYGNLENAISKLSDSDIVFMSSGDDVFCDGIFKEALLQVEKNAIDIKNELFCLYFDWKSISPNGDEMIFSNHLIKYGYNPISLKIRGLIYNRSVGISSNTLKKFTSVQKDKGISVAEGAFDIQFQLHSKTSYYHSFVGSIYYSGLGVSKTMNNNEERNSYIISLENDLMINILSNKDKYYLKYKICRTKYTLNPSIILFILCNIYLIKSIELKYGVNLKFHVKDLFRMIIKRR